jgi:phosphoribosylanthranilate isomerase
MTTRVKICGITRDEDARLAVELGAAALGFNFYPRSPRYVDPKSASAIIRQLPPFVSAVGIFADEADAESIAALARQVGLTAVQLHGPRFPQNRGALDGFPTIRAVAVMPGFTLDALRTLDATAILLDAFDPSLFGGTGKAIDWSLARMASGLAKPVILAGGLTSDNVEEAVRIVRPYAVDVATGVESGPGVKDLAKMRAFFAAVNRADRTCHMRDHGPVRRAK